MKQSLPFFIFFLLCSFGVSAQYFEWAQKQESVKFPPSIAAGSSLIASTGTFYKTITIGNQTLTGADSNNVYLAVHDHRGNFRWAKHIRNNSYTEPKVTVDADQNVIITGTYVDSLYIDGLLFSNPAVNMYGVYLVKFSPAGNLIWARRSEPTLIATLLYNHTLDATSVATDAAGNIYLAGNFMNTLTFNGTTLTATNPQDAFAAKFNPTGNLLWAYKAGSSNFNAGAAIKPGTNGNAYFVYSFTNNASQRGYVISRLNAAGTAPWSRTVNYPLAYFPLNLAVDHADNAYLSGYFSNAITFGSLTLNASQATQEEAFLAKINPAGTWKWARAINPVPFPGANKAVTWGPPPIYATSDNRLGMGIGPHVLKLDTAGTTLWTNGIIGESSATSLTGDENGNLFVSGQFSTSAQFSATTLTGTGWWHAYLTKVLNHGNLVTGSAFVDANANGVKDTGERPYPGLVLENAPDPLYAITGTDGGYRYYASAGAFTLSLPNPPRYYVAAPVSFNLNLNGINQVQTNNDFALQPIPNQNDVRVTITSLTPARPGFGFLYRLTYYNAGTTVLSDTIRFTHNVPHLTFLTASQLPLSQQPGSLTWNYQNLQPHETRHIDVTFTVPVSSVLGTPLAATAQINPIAIDLNPSDNTDTLEQVLVGSFDPNDKQVDKPFISPAAGANGTFLDYTIRFQNTGTDTAFTVVVTDKISAGLSLPDFEMLSASHPYKVSIQDGNRLEWRFDNILLPDSNRNEPASHGFIRFRIKTKPGLLLGDSVANQAAIFFDFNAPVITNDAVTKVGAPTGLGKPKTELSAFRLYPNPARNYVIVASAFKNNTAATVSLINMLGQTLSQVTLPANNQIHYQLPLKNVPKGLYLIRVATATGTQTQRLVVQ